MNIGQRTHFGNGHTSGAGTVQIVSFDPVLLVNPDGVTPGPEGMTAHVFGNATAQRTAVSNVVRSIMGRAIMQLQSGVWVLIAGELIGASIGTAALAGVATNIVNVPNGARPLVAINATGVAGLEIDWGIKLEVMIFVP